MRFSESLFVLACRPGHPGPLFSVCPALVPVIVPGRPGLAIIEGGGRHTKFRGLAFTLFALVWGSLWASPVWSGTDAFEAGDYRHCPAYHRLSAPTGLHYDLGAEAGSITVSWDALVVPAGLPDVWATQLTVIAEGAGPRQVRHAPLGATAVTFQELALAHTGTLSLAMTAGPQVLSDIATLSFRTGVATPQLRTPFYYQMGDRPRVTQGHMHYVGFGHSFANWYVDTGHTLPQTPRFRLGVRHGSGYDPGDADFAHFRLQLADVRGADILGFEAATVPAGDLYQGKVLVLGAVDDPDIADPETAPFATLKHSNRLSAPAPAVWEAAVTAPYWTSDRRPLVASQPGGRSEHPLSFTNLANHSQGRALFAPVPDEIYELPPDTLFRDGTYRLTAWAEDTAGARISPVCTLELSVSTRIERTQLYTNVWGFDRVLGSNRHDTEARHSGPGRVLDFLLLADDCVGPALWEAPEPAAVASSRSFSLLPAPLPGLAAGYNLSYWVAGDGQLQMLDDVVGGRVLTIPANLRTPPAEQRYKAVGVGLYLACARRQDDDSLTCWGSDRSWLQEEPPSDLGAVKTFAVGGYHACAVKQADDSVQCWGYGGMNQTASPEGAFHAVTGGRLHSCGLRTDGQVECWGLNNFKQGEVPAQLGPVRALVSGHYHNCAVRADDTAICWGLNHRGQSDVPNNLGPVKALSAGLEHTCALKSNDLITCWGGDAYGQVRLPPSSGTWQEISAGTVHSCGKRQDGHVECWRFRDASSPPMRSLSSGEVATCGIRQADGLLQCWGYLFPFSGINRLVAVDGRGVYPVVFKSFVNATTVHCGLKTDDTLECWGRGEAQGLHPGILTEMPADLGRLKAVAGYRENACAIKADDSLVCWGTNNVGQATVPNDLGTVKAVDVGALHTCVIEADDSVTCWGDNGLGQTDVPSDLGTVKAIAAGDFHTCVIKADDSVTCWGRDNLTIDDVPSDLGAVKVLAVSRGGSHACAIKADDSVACWPSGGACTVAPSSCDPESVPSNLAKASDVSAGSEHVCVLLKADQTVSCWGMDSYGETKGPKYP